MSHGQDEHLFHVLIILGVQCNTSYNSEVLLKGLAPEMAAAQQLEDPSP